MSKKALGKGLSALIPTEEKPLSAGPALLALEVIQPNRFQPRTAPDSARMAELTASIRTSGVLEPVVVRPLGEGYELIAGERRWLAARQAGLRDIPAVIREATDAEALELALIENLQREDLNPMEEAKAYERLAEQFGHTQQEIADKVGKDRTTVANTLRLLALPPQIQAMVKSGQLSEGHARALLSLPSAQDQSSLAQKIIARKLSVRQTELEVRKMVSPRLKLRAMAAARRDSHLRAAEEALQKVFGTKVRIRQMGERGRIEVEFYSQVDLDRILEVLKVQL
jgi:ParB family transcriptional regulator, chromosome partitioning protein